MSPYIDNTEVTNEELPVHGTGDANTERRGAAAAPERAEESEPSTARAWTALARDVAVPLAVFYGSRAAGIGQLPALILSGLAPLAGILLTWARQRRVDPTALFVIAAMVLSVLVAMVTGDPRTLLARESWVTAALGLWILGSLAMARPFLLDAAVKAAPAGMAHRLDRLWRSNPVVRRWMQVASVAWGVAFLLDALIRVVMAYTLPLDSVPTLGVVLLVVTLGLAQAVVTLHGRRNGALALIRRRD
ncbi:VC0807 family protein [Streptomyces sp. NPDC093707]|uniref:VC0807 family protein n=1 Tax=Streptomyces sp. NPDC093707 TaxID=3154984 RepID=UPI00344C6F91